MFRPLLLSFALSLAAGVPIPANQLDLPTFSLEMLAQSNTQAPANVDWSQNAVPVAVSSTAAPVAPGQTTQATPVPSGPGGVSPPAQAPPAAGPSSSAPAAPVQTTQTTAAPSTAPPTTTPTVLSTTTQSDYQVIAGRVLNRPDVQLIVAQLVQQGRGDVIIYEDNGLCEIRTLTGEIIKNGIPCGP